MLFECPAGHDLFVNLTRSFQRVNHSARPKVGCGYTTARGIGRKQTDCDKVSESFYRFWSGPPNSNNTAANTIDFVSTIENFLSTSKKVRQECTRILQGSRLGNNSFRKLTHAILTNVRFRGVLFADRPPTFESKIAVMVKDCECNCVDSRSQNLVRTQLCQMISVNALVWPGIGIMNVTSTPSTKHSIQAAKVFN